MACIGEALNVKKYVFIHGAFIHLPNLVGASYEHSSAE